jgi:hypothetical protein
MSECISPKSDGILVSADQVLRHRICIFNAVTSYVTLLETDLNLSRLTAIMTNCD